jgi:parallel beta-helix repeat protein
MKLPKSSTSHSPIILIGDAEVDAFFSGNATDGLTWQSAYILDSLEFNDVGYNYYNDIKLVDTTRYIKISNCVFLYSTTEEILFENVTHVNISNCDITSDITGIEITDSDDIIIEYNTFNGLYTTFQSFGINIEDSENCSIIENKISNFMYGINCYPSSNSTIKDNEVSHSERDNIRVSGFHNEIFNNTCSHSEYYSGLNILGSNNSIENNTCNSNGRFNNGEGIRLQGINNTLIGNDCYWNDKGILINGFNNTLIRNNCTYNQGYGLDLYGGSNCTFLENLIAFNLNGLKLGNNIKNLTCLDNVFIENGINYPISSNAESNFLTYKMDNTNIINSKPLFFEKNQNDISLLGDYGQYILVNCNNTEISNFNADMVENGISLIGCDNSTISNSTFNYKYYGVILIDASTSSIRECSFIGSNFQYSYAMFLYDSQNLMIENNLIQDSDYGLYGSLIDNSSITDNEFVENMREGMILYNSDYCNITKNSFYNNEINDFHMWSSDNCRISENSFTECGDISLYVDNSYNHTINQNVFGENESYSDNYGIFSEGSTFLDISNNSFIKLKTGIIIGSFNTNHTIRSNILFDCRNYGILINSSDWVESITIYENFFFFTGACDNSEGTNWDNGSVGNYWYDYWGDDLDGDGIGDIPYYLIDGTSNSQDDYPIVLDNNTQSDENGFLENFIQFGVPVLTGAFAGLIMAIILSKKKSKG